MMGIISDYQRCLNKCRDAKFRIKTSSEMNEGLQWLKFINIVIDILCLPGTWFGSMASSSLSSHNAKLVISGQ